MPQPSRRQFLHFGRTKPNLDLILFGRLDWTQGRMVGAVRFELTTSCTRNKRASQPTLRPEPDHELAVSGAELQCLFLVAGGERQSAV
jgi:hypothetical protein